MRHIPVNDSTEKDLSLFLGETLDGCGDLLMDLFPGLDVVAGGVAVSRCF